ncbi:polysaccharide biosynthesis protein [Haloprofundus marisrubri]|uniref:Polysaccharide biosynthesis protein n=1 Tax=Haloprofundus marisrubri TaxID=1514971 RepID=A0A0W1RC22_9EURY|nr:polysaccharide biosynthesis C-terminal domain-containing protein [Haloprofundus marisrubri]KTG11015.1 polysaccharide biosynthesis protein [Haloprofundus marisrubri]
MGRNVVRGFLSIFSSDVGVLILSISITPILVRVLTSAEYGNYAFVMSVLSITMIVINAGIFDGIRKYIAEQRPDADWDSNVFAYYMQVGLALAFAAVVIILVVLQLGVIERLFTPEFETYFYILAALVVIRQLWAIGRGTLMGLGYEHISEPTKMARWVIFALVGVPLAAIGWGVVGVLIGRVVARGLVALAVFWYVSKYVSLGSVFRKVPSEFPRRELLSYNSFSVILILLTSSLYHVDLILLRTLSGAQQTGYYNAALIVAEFLWFVPTAMQTVLLQSTSEWWSQDKVDTVTDVTSRATRYVVLITAIMCIGIASLANQFVSLYFGAEYLAAVDPLLLLLPGTLGFAVARPIFAVGQGKGELRLLILATGAAAALNLVLNLLLIPRYGTLGAATSTSIGYGSMVVFHVLVARRIGFDPISDLRLGRIVAATLVAAIPVFGLPFVLNGDILELAIVPPVGFVVFVVAAVLFGAIDRSEVNEVRQRLSTVLPTG